MKKTVLFILVSAMCVGILSSCINSPEAYLESFEKFIEKVEARDLSELSEKQIAKIESEYTKYADTYYDKFSDEMSFKQKTKYAKLCLRYHYKMGKETVKDIFGASGEVLDGLLNGAAELTTDVSALMGLIGE